MGAAIELRGDMSAADFRRSAKASRDANQARRLLAMAAIRDGMSRAEAARIGGMDRQTLPDWVHAFNERGIEGLINRPLPGRPPKLSDAQKAELKAIVLEGPDRERDGVVRWRCIDLVRVVEERFAVTVDADTIGRVLHELKLSHLSARPRHPDQAPEAMEVFKNATCHH